MGGRLDAVNIVDSDVAYIVSIGRDHTQWLGDGRDQIAREKAGIMRYQRPVVCADIDPPDSIVECAEKFSARLWQINQDFGYRQQGSSWSWWESAQAGKKELNPLPIPDIPGDKQLLNAAGVLCVIARMQQALPVGEQQIVDGLSSALIPGRLQVIDQEPTLIFDVAHNADSVQCLANFLKAGDCAGKTIAVFAVLADKPLQEIATIMSERIDRWFVAGLDGERGSKGADILAGISAILGDADVTSFDHPVAAYQAAIQKASNTDRIVVFGSFVTVGAIMEFLGIPVYR